MGISQEPLDIYNSPDEPGDLSPVTDKVLGREQTAVGAAAAAFEMGYKTTFVHSMAKWSALNDLDNGATKISPLELNKKYPKMPAPFVEEMTDIQAQFVVEQQLDTMKLQEEINKGPDGLFYGGINFAASMAAHMLDPVEMGSGYLVGPLLAFATKGTAVGTALGVSKIAARGRFAKFGLKTVPSMVGASPAQRAAMLAIDGTLGNLAAEVPIAAVSGKMMEDYTALDAFVSTAGGAMGFAALGYAGGAGARFLRRMNIEDQIVVHNVAFAQAEKLGRVNVEPLYKDIAMRTNGTPRDGGTLGRGKYEYKTRVEGDGRKFYATFKGDKAGFDLKDQALMHEEMVSSQRNLSLTDSDTVANGSASDGQIFEVEFDGKLLNLNEITEEGSLAINGVIHKFPEVKRFVSADVTPKQFYDDLHAAVSARAVPAMALDDFFKEIELNGFDGVFHDGSNFYGNTHNKHNAVTIFESKVIDKTKVKGRVQGQPQLVPKLSRTDRIKGSEKYNAPSQHFDYDPELVARVEDLKTRPQGEAVLSEVKTEVEQTLREYETVKAAAPEELKAEFKEIDELAKENDAIVEAYDIAEICFGDRR